MRAETSRRSPQNPMSIYEILLGSCGCVIEAAAFLVPERGRDNGVNDSRTQHGTRNKSATAFAKNTCNIGTFHSGPSPPIISKSKSAQGEIQRSLKRSKEVVEIPEYLGPEIMDENTCKTACDEISALSALTLDEMASSRTVMVVVQKRRKPKEMYPYGSSLTTSTATTMGSLYHDDNNNDAVSETHSRYLIEPPCLVKKIHSYSTNDSAYFSHPFPLDSSYYLSKTTQDSSWCESPALSPNNARIIFRSPGVTSSPKEALWL